MTTATISLTRDEVKALKAEHRSIARRMAAGEAPTDADRAALDRYARATAQSWANYTGEVQYLYRLGMNLYPTDAADIAFRAANGLPAREICEAYGPVARGWYATSLGTA